MYAFLLFSFFRFRVLAGAVTRGGSTLQAIIRRQGPEKLVQRFFVDPEDDEMIQDEIAILMHDLRNLNGETAPDNLLAKFTPELLAKMAIEVRAEYEAICPSTSEVARGSGENDAADNLQSQISVLMMELRKLGKKKASADFKKKFTQEILDAMTTEAYEEYERFFKVVGKGLMDISAAEDNVIDLASEESVNDPDPDNFDDPDPDNVDDPDPDNIDDHDGSSFAENNSVYVQQSELDLNDLDPNDAHYILEMKKIIERELSVVEATYDSCIDENGTPQVDFLRRPHPADTALKTLGDPILDAVMTRRQKSKFAKFHKFFQFLFSKGAEEDMKEDTKKDTKEDTKEKINRRKKKNKNKRNKKPRTE